MSEPHTCQQSQFCQDNPVNKKRKKGRVYDIFGAFPGIPGAYLGVPQGLGLNIPQLNVGKHGT